jgi:competence protein ComEC
METAQNTQSISPRSLAILIALWGFIFGILVSSLVSIKPILAVFIVLLSAISYGVIKVGKQIEGSEEGLHMPREAMLIIIFVCMFGVGALRYAIKDYHELMVPTSTGIVASEPEHRDKDTRFVFEANNGERVLVSTDMYSSVKYGDRIEIEGKLKRPGVIEEEDGKSFDYAKFLSKDDIYYTMSFAKIRLSDGQTTFDSRSSSGHSLRWSVRLVRELLNIKNKFVHRIKSILPEPESSLLAGLIVAGKEALPEKVLNDFKNAGVVHIVVLSGYNITVIADFFLLTLVGLSLRKRMLVSGIGILFFVLMTGASASIVRASIMAIAVLLGKALHRPYSAPRALVLTGTIMLLFNPKLLVFDPSFQLSFLAMLALIYVEPIISNRLGFITERLGLRGLVAVTLATQLTVLPFLLYSSGSVSIVSLFTNLLILIIVPYTMLVGFVATILSFVSTTLAWPFAFLAHICLSWILLVAHFFGNLSYANIKVSHFPLWLTLVIYICMTLVIWSTSRSSLRQTSN